MEAGGNGEIEPESRGAELLDCVSLGNSTPLLPDKVPGMAVGLEPLYKHWSGANPSVDGCWMPIDSAAHNLDNVTSPVASFGQLENSSFTDLLQSQGTSRTSYLHFQSDHGFGNGGFPEMDSFFIQRRCSQITNFDCSANFSQQGNVNATEEVLNSQSTADNYTQAHVKSKTFDNETVKPSPSGKKRKKEDWSRLAPSKHMETDKEMDLSIGDQDEKKRRPERKPDADMSHQVASKQVKETSTSGDASKEDYVHVRAKRGQATNSHSLAERVRREKIRERMKFLQDLVPGCSKITGKAVMLDEIINYVLSLQQQVEFLSMKLATVYPEMNVDSGQALPRDIYCSQGGRSTIPGDTGMKSFHEGVLQGGSVAAQTLNLESPIMPNVGSIWHNELDDKASEMDFIPHLTSHNSDSNGCGKVEP